jgi:hypothetical protein
MSLLTSRINEKVCQALNNENHKQDTKPKCSYDSKNKTPLHRQGLVHFVIRLLARLELLSSLSPTDMINYYVIQFDSPFRSIHYALS